MAYLSLIADRGSALSSWFIWESQSSSDKASSTLSSLPSYRHPIIRIIRSSIAVCASRVSLNSEGIGVSNPTSCGGRVGGLAPPKKNGVILIRRNIGTRCWHIHSGREELLRMMMPCRQCCIAASKSPCVILDANEEYADNQYHLLITSRLYMLYSRIIVINSKVTTTNLPSDTRASSEFFIERAN